MLFFELVFFALIKQDFNFDFHYLDRKRELMQFLFILIRFDSIRFGLQYEIYKLLIAIILIKKRK